MFNVKILAQVICFARRYITWTLADIKGIIPFSIYLLWKAYFAQLGYARLGSSISSIGKPTSSTCQQNEEKKRELAKNREDLKLTERVLVHPSFIIPVFSYSLTHSLTYLLTYFACRSTRTQKLWPQFPGCWKTGQSSEIISAQTVPSTGPTGLQLVSQHWRKDLSLSLSLLCLQAADDCWQPISELNWGRAVFFSLFDWLTD